MRDIPTERVEGFEECTNYAGPAPERQDLRKEPTKRGVACGTYHLHGAESRDVPPAQGRPSSPVAQHGMRVGACRRGTTALAVRCGDLWRSRSLLARGPGRKIAGHGVPVMPALSAL